MASSSSPSQKFDEVVFRGGPWDGRHFVVVAGKMEWLVPVNHYVPPPPWKPDPNPPSFARGTRYVHVYARTENTMHYAGTDYR